MLPLVVIKCEIQPGHRRRQVPAGRDAIRSELRGELNRKLAELTGRPHARMWYSPEDYAEKVVRGYGYKLVEWPKDVPFCNFSDEAFGGIESLRRIAQLWRSQTLRFEPSTNDDRILAKDPLRVHPNPEKIKPETVRRKPGAQSSSEVVLRPVVRTLDEMQRVGVHPTPVFSEGAQDLKATSRKRKRCQRNDVKKRRRRKTDSDELPKRLPKRGVRSRRYVQEWVGKDGVGRYCMTDDPIDEFTSCSSSDGDGDFSETESIESASGEW
ncbi:hypothetical protein GY45DRAFT_1439588 [Cubamyces sp. BRFM 1775]|nr:hypothetical protein GY45DRAFT_1439588 [Cubamyces sp. BRFM 1775]